MTALFLAGSPKVRAGVAEVRRMRSHVDACPRCRATESRFAAGQEGFVAARDEDPPEEVLEAIRDIFAVPQEEPEEPRARAARTSGHDARRAGVIVTDHFNALLEKAEQQADRIRRDAIQDAEDIRREAVTAAERLMGRLQALEFPLGQLVSDLRTETQRVSKQIEAPPANATRMRPLPPPAAPADVPRPQEEAKSAPEEPPPVQEEQVSAQEAPRRRAGSRSAG